MYDENLSTNVKHLSFNQLFLSHYGATQHLIDIVEDQTVQISTITNNYQLTLQEQINLLNNTVSTLTANYQDLLNKVSTLMG